MPRQLVENIGGVRQWKIVAHQLLIECAVIHAQAPFARLTRFWHHEHRGGVRARGGTNEAGGEELLELIAARRQLHRRETVRANSSWRVVRELKFLQKIRVERRQSVRKVLELSLKVPQDGSEPGGQSGVEGREALRVGREVDRAQGHLSDERRACQGDARGAYAEVKEDDVGGVNVLGAASPTPLLRREDFDIRQSRLPHCQQVGRRGRPRAP